MSENSNKMRDNTHQIQVKCLYEPFSYTETEFVSDIRPITMNFNSKFQLSIFFLPSLEHSHHIGRILNIFLQISSVVT